MVCLSGLQNPSLAQQDGFCFRNFRFQFQDELAIEKNGSRQCFASMLALLERSAHRTT
ncbi:hypothetical protein RRSWK_02787 [Rhodopirellula sp. SWK7]|nr:hypothetical protein RRSWK_02787 [Rhodopirellula sp. SWK7]